MSRPLKVLLVEDSPLDAELIVQELIRSGFAPDLQRADSEAAYLRLLHKDLDLILSDYGLPGFDGVRALELLKSSGLEIPFIMVSGTIGDDSAVEVIKRGATDYLLKDRLARLGPALLRALQEVKERKQRREMERQLIEAQKMEVIGQLAGGVAHDFNNILAVIMGYTDLMLMKLPSDNECRGFAETIRSASERAGALTKQLLIFSRKQAVQPVVLDINEVVHDLDKLLRRLIDENIEMTVIPGKDIGHIKADAGYIGQVLMNLAVNARDAMPNGGTLTISTWNTTVDETDARAQKGVHPGDYVVLSVSDTGTGMTPEVKAQIFNAFFTTKPKGKGTGLGLATCQTIVLQSGGHIKVESEVGQGTTFHIYFPRVEAPIEVSPSIHQTGPLPHGTETLLLVEDDPSVRHLACDVLEAHGYRVLRASNGQDGLRVARDFKGGTISLVITDVVMPQMGGKAMVLPARASWSEDVVMPQMGGKAMADWLQAINPHLKILFTSGYMDDINPQEGTLQSEVEFLPKPYATATLLRKVREILDR